MRLNNLLQGVSDPYILNPCDFEVKGIACDSRLIKDGFVFVAIKGVNDDGHNYIAQAIRNGAKAIIFQTQDRKTQPFCAGEVAGLDKIQRDCCWVGVGNTRQALAELGARFFGYPSRELPVVGITGTNGKTTTAYLIEAMLKEAGYEPAVIGTINYRFKGRIIPANNTTPNSLDIQWLLASMKKEGINFVITEVSSHALDQQRVSGIDFSQAIFTNLTGEHLDYHGNIESYFQAKAKLFRCLNERSASIINIDDPYSKRILDSTRSRIVSYGLNNKALVTAGKIRCDIQGVSFQATTPKEEFVVHSPLIGRYNIYNLLACISLGVDLNIGADKIKNAIDKLKVVPGRLESVDCGQDFLVFVDYAHTDDALKQVLTALRELNGKRIIVVFGCGGNRDKTKRPRMGEVASLLGDFVILTSDNPRGEQPQDIVADIAKGIKNKNYKIIPDRRSAILDSLRMASPGDIVLIAGKGHEDYQVFKNKVIHFNDAEAVRECLRSMN